MSGCLVVECDNCALECPYNFFYFFPHFVGFSCGKNNLRKISCDLKKLLPLSYHMIAVFIASHIIVEIVAVMESTNS